LRRLGRLALAGLWLVPAGSAAFAGERSILFDEGRDYRHCASMCLQLAMQAMRHVDRGQVDPALSVSAMCADNCRTQAEREGLADADRAAIMTDTLNGLQKPPSWGIPGGE
jgi:hypothetical protein